MIVLKNNSFLIVLCVFTWIGYFVRTIPVGSISHIVYIAILMCVIHVVTLKFCHVHIRWFRGVVSVTGKFRHARAPFCGRFRRALRVLCALTVAAEVNMGFLPKFKISRKYQFTGEARVCRWTPRTWSDAGRWRKNSIPFLDRLLMNYFMYRFLNLFAKSVHGRPDNTLPSAPVYRHRDKSIDFGTPTVFRRNHRDECLADISSIVTGQQLFIG